MALRAMPGARTKPLRGGRWGVPGRSRCGSLRSTGPLGRAS